MQITMQVFIIAAAIALLVQTSILIVLFLQLKKTTESVNKMVGDMHSRVGPILTRTQILLDDTQPKISALVEDAAHTRVRRCGGVSGRRCRRRPRSCRESRSGWTFCVRGGLLLRREIPRWSRKTSCLSELREVHANSLCGRVGWIFFCLRFAHSPCSCNNPQSRKCEDGIFVRDVHGSCSH